MTLQGPSTSEPPVPRELLYMLAYRRELRAVHWGGTLPDSLRSGHAGDLRGIHGQPLGPSAIHRAKMRHRTVGCTVYAAGRHCQGKKGFPSFQLPDLSSTAADTHIPLLPPANLAQRHSHAGDYHPFVSLRPSYAHTYVYAQPGLQPGPFARTASAKLGTH